MNYPSSRLPENVHIIPLGHEIDRAVKPLLKNKADRVHLLAIPPDAELDPVMKEKQMNYTQVRQEAIIWIANESHPIHSGCSYSVVRYW